MIFQEETNTIDNFLHDIFLMSNCPCGLSQPYQHCCGRYIETAAHAPSAETLMRTRYTAYSQANIDYIAKTMRGKPRQGFSKKQAFEWASTANWLKLEVVDATETTVDFKAYYEFEGQPKVLHEKSLFKLHKGQWFYVGEAQS